MSRLQLPEAAEKLIKTCVDSFGRLDILSALLSRFEFVTSNLAFVLPTVNNAGVQHVAPIESFPIEQWNK